MSAINQSKKVALGLSGGVDSAVAASELMRAGWAVTAVFIECFREEGCRTDQDRKDALAVALKLGIPLVSLDFREAYREKVWTYFYAEYAAGRTPNPDVLCNREIKFGLFLEWAEAAGFGKVATGHYARVVSKNKLIDSGLFSNIDQEKYMAMAVDEHKDQTYFLNQIPRAVLPRVMFPLWGMKKTEVRAKAAELGLAVATKKDSTGVCFVGEINVRDFLREKLGTRRGQIVDRQGRVLGEHEGAWFYTLGQRHGLKIDAQSAAAKPYFVIEKNMVTNEVVVGSVEETEVRELRVAEMNWLIGGEKKVEVEEKMEGERGEMGGEGEVKGGRREKIAQLVAAGRLWVRIRHLGELVVVSGWEEDELGKVKVSLEQAVRGVSEGQFAVFYTRVGEVMVCLGGGEIDGV